jgi:hypothetical protein
VSRFEDKETAPEQIEPPEPATPKPPEPPETGSANPAGPKVSQRPRGALGYYETTIQRRSLGQVKADAKRTLALAKSAGVGKRVLTTGNRSVFAAIAHASAPPLSRGERTEQVLNLEHQGPTEPQQGVMEKQSPKRAADGAEIPVDGSITPASEPETGKESWQRSVLQLIRHSLLPRVESGQENPDISQP